MISYHLLILFPKENICIHQADVLTSTNNKLYFLHNYHVTQRLGYYRLSYLDKCIVFDFYKCSFLCESILLRPGVCSCPT